MSSFRKNSCFLDFATRYVAGILVLVFDKILGRSQTPLKCFYSRQFPRYQATACSQAHWLGYTYLLQFLKLWPGNYIVILPVFSRVVIILETLGRGQTILFRVFSSETRTLLLEIAQLISSARLSCRRSSWQTCLDDPSITIADVNKGQHWLTKSWLS